MNKDQKLEHFNDILRALNLPIVEAVNTPKYTIRTEGKQMERTGQDMALDNVRNGAYIIGSIDVLGNISFNNHPAVHNTPALARQEAARLARANPGKAFVFVKMVGAEMVPTATVSI